jgi:hypothetical protein
MDLGAKTAVQFAQQFQKAEAIGIITKDFPPFIGAGGDQITASGQLDAQSPSHKVR